MLSTDLLRGGKLNRATTSPGGHCDLCSLEADVFQGAIAGGKQTLIS